MKFRHRFNLPSGGFCRIDLLFRIPANLFLPYTTFKSAFFPNGHIFSILIDGDYASIPLTLWKSPDSSSRGIDWKHAIGGGASSAMFPRCVQEFIVICENGAQLTQTFRWEILNCSHLSCVLFRQFEIYFKL